MVLIDPDGRQVSFKKLTSNVQTAIMNDLKTISGYTFKVSNEGFLQIDNSVERISKGTSNTAAMLLEELMKYSASIIPVVSNNAKTQYDPINKGVNININETEQFIKNANNINPLTYGYGMMFLHEILHSAFMDLDPDELLFEVNHVGIIEVILNIIRSELGVSEWGQIQTHKAIPFQGLVNNSFYVPFDKYTMQELMKGGAPSNDKRFTKYEEKRR